MERFPDDDHGHGTHVAGIIGAQGDNAIGVAGVAWESKLVIVKVLASDNKEKAVGTPIGTSISGAVGIKWAADQLEVNIINASFGEIGVFPVFRNLLNNAVDYAWGKGKLVIAAAANSNNTDQYYPAASSNAIAVGNSTISDTRHADPLNGSNYGSWVDLVAPGVHIWSTTWDGGYADEINPGTPAIGTSMSTAMVSGAAAVLWEYVRESHSPPLTTVEIRNKVIEFLK